MTSFLDGPAAGQTIALRRAPLLLRVVCDPCGNWDALDRLYDEPNADEHIYVYRRTADEVMPVFVRPGGMYMIAKYRVLDEQPVDQVVRDRGLWRSWASRIRETKSTAQTSPMLFDFPEDRGMQWPD